MSEHTMTLDSIIAIFDSLAREHYDIEFDSCVTQSDIDAARAAVAELASEVERLKRDNAILELKNRGTLANNLCPDHRDKQVGKPCLACTIETLRRRVEELERDRDYCRWKLGLVIPVFQEARDALCALSTTQIKLHGISSTLDKRMDYAGTADIEQYQSTIASAKGDDNE